ncbi:hypothetical protein [Paenibacillus sp. FSL R7-0273]|uniref:hypothetical protein n=1 Tax=Paenibacillus sp. FSL R7-0273 TaxID=1536772 RepID=UPI0006938019|nr:hypothetical protein [Paenibacillus sp. FSL R7-0273]OMF84792.1 hypothetical protein BK144_29300 [Paenibacillus sp. FSL R7-0273]
MLLSTALIAHAFPLNTSGREIVIVVKNQTVKLPKGSRSSAATQVGSGGGTYSTGGTNSAIESPYTRQQHAVGGGAGGHAVNSSRLKRKPAPGRKR